MSINISKIIRAPMPPQQPIGWIGHLGRELRTLLLRLGRPVARNLVNLIALAALLIVLSYATFTTSHERIARYSGVLSDLSLALLAAWVFNLLVVELPRRRDRQQLYTGVAWMIGLMAHAGIEMMEFLSIPARVSIAVDPRVAGVIVAADRDLADRICAAITPTTPYVPLPGAAGCWELIGAQVDKSRKYHQRLQPWLGWFDAQVNAAMNAVTMSNLADLCEGHPQISNTTLEDLGEYIYDHWEACDNLMEMHYKLVQPYVLAWRQSIPRGDRRHFTPQKHREKAVQQALAILNDGDQTPS